MSDYYDQFAKCPFYHTSSHTTIDCEGIKGASCMKHTFENKRAKEFYKISHCDSEYKDCEIFKVLWRKYEK